MNVKKDEIIRVMVMILILVMVTIVLNIVSKYENNKINAVIIKEEACLYKKKNEDSKVKGILNIGDNVTILKQIKDKNNIFWYKVKYGKNNGYILSENADYYEFDNDKYALMSDVSKFNIQYETIKSVEDYERFLVQNDINYAYIRAGGRGYGAEGNLYIDAEYQKFIDACEYLGVPYGFYFIDEAINLKEIEEEAEWILDFIKNNGGENAILPFAIDIEKFSVKARTDDIVDKRYELIQDLIDKLSDVGVETIVYSNAQKANEYLVKIDSDFWLAYYTSEDKLPNTWIDGTNQGESLNKDLLNKTVAWQFTKSGVGKIIKEKVDINLVKNDFFKAYILQK